MSTVRVAARTSFPTGLQPIVWWELFCNPIHRGAMYMGTTETRKPPRPNFKEKCRKTKRKRLWKVQMPTDLKSDKSSLVEHGIQCWKWQDPCAIRFPFFDRTLNSPPHRSLHFLLSGFIREFTGLTHPRNSTMPECFEYFPLSSAIR